MCSITLAVAAAYVATAPRRVAARAGTLARAAALGAPEIIGTIDPKQLSAGPIVAVTLQGPHAYLLQNHTWLRASRAGVEGPFGNETRGAQGWIASAAAIAVRDSTVYVLDRLGRSVHEFAVTGEWRRTVRLEGTKLSGFLPERIAAGSTGPIVLSGYRTGADAGWSILLLDNDTPRIVFHRPSNVFDLLLPLVRPDGSITALAASEYEFAELPLAGGKIRRFIRHDPPRFALEPEERAAIQRYLTSTPASNRPEYQPPVYIPAVAHAHPRSSGTFLVAVATGVDSVFVEEVDSGGRALRTFLRPGVPLPVGLFDDGIVVLREEAQRTLVERYSLPGMNP
jgi:hypothetical protein